MTQAFAAPVGGDLFTNGSGYQPHANTSAEQTKVEEVIMKFPAHLRCSKCQEPIIAGEGFGYVCFKTPGREGYHYFHYRFRGGDCWGTYLRGRNVENNKERS
jgi:hypothetical protein